ncbi:ubiquitin-conjugating enzyme E2 C [Camelus ferus]|nr:ubiquitin-conjugating enzyme E2 C [Camelus ferus]
MSADRISAFSESDISKWVGTTQGALSLQFPGGFHHSTSSMKLLSPGTPPCGHQGHIGPDISEDKWAALCDVRTTLLSMYSLPEPNTGSPLNTNAKF